MASWKVKGIFKADADKVYAEISALDEITPQAVLEKAKNKRSELHKCITWDKDEAAQKWQLNEARQIIQLLVVTPREEEAQPVRVFQISSERNTYQKVEYFQRNEDEYQILLQRAIAELRALEKRYKHIAELETVFNAIDEL